MTTSPLVIISWLVVIAAVALFFAYQGVRFGRMYVHHQLLFELRRRENLRLTLRRLLGLTRSRSEALQDLWAMLTARSQGQPGFYVDIGSADGEACSNSRLLEGLNWSGVCIDAFPRNMGGRSCRIVQTVLFRESGVTVAFKNAGGVGGIVSKLGSRADERSDAQLVELQTRTLTEVLDEVQAPRHIDYISLDVEGAEIDVLEGLDFDRYTIGALTIEHNYEEEKREAVRRLLESHGYVRVRSWRVDDWFLSQSLSERFRYRLVSELNA